MSISPIGQCTDCEVWWLLSLTQRYQPVVHSGSDLCTTTKYTSSNLDAAYLVGVFFWKPWSVRFLHLTSFLPSFICSFPLPHSIFDSFLDYSVKSKEAAGQAIFKLILTECANCVGTQHSLNIECEWPRHMTIWRMVTENAHSCSQMCPICYTNHFRRGHGDYYCCLWDDLYIQWWYTVVWL